METIFPGRVTPRIPAAAGMSGLFAARVSQDGFYSPSAEMARRTLLRPQPRPGDIPHLLSEYSVTASSLVPSWSAVEATEATVGPTTLA